MSIYCENVKLLLTYHINKRIKVLNVLKGKWNVLKLEDGRKDIKKEQVMNFGSSFLNPNVEYFSLCPI